MKLSSAGMRTPLPSCRKNPALTPSGGCCIELEGSVATCEIWVPSRFLFFPLVWDPLAVRGRGEEGEMNAGDWNCGRSGVKGVIPPLWDDLLERTAWVARDWEGKDRSFKVELWFKEKTVKGLRSSEKKEEWMRSRSVPLISDCYV